MKDCIVMRRLLSIFLVSALFFNVFAYILAFRFATKTIYRHYHEGIYSFSYWNAGDFIILDGSLHPDDPTVIGPIDDYFYEGRPFEIIDLAKTQNPYQHKGIRDCEHENWRSVFTNNLCWLEKSGTPAQQNTVRLIIPVFKVPVPEKLILQIFQKDWRYQTCSYFYSVQTAVLNAVFVPPKVS